MDDEVRKRLISARKAAGYPTPSDAGRAMVQRGVVGAVSTYLAHENGHKGIRLEAGERYARFFGERPGWLLFGDGEPKLGHKAEGDLYHSLTEKPQDGEAEKEGTMPKEAELVNIFRGLSSDSQATLISSAKVLAYDEMKRQRPFRKRPA